MRKLVNDAWINELCQMECFEGVDIRTELTKAQRWMVGKRNRQFTQRFFLNWLKKCPARPARPASPTFEETF